MEKGECRFSELRALHVEYFPPDFSVFFLSDSYLSRVGVLRVRSTPYILPRYTMYGTENGGRNGFDPPLSLIGRLRCES